MNFDSRLTKYILGYILLLEVIQFMAIAKIFKNGKSQAVRLPKEFRFEDGEEVLIKKVGEIVYLCPKNKAWGNFLESEPIDDDVWEAIEYARKNEIRVERDEL